MSDVLAPAERIHALFYRFKKSSVVGQEPVDGLLHQILGPPACAARHISEAGFLLRTDANVHRIRVEGWAWRVNCITAVVKPPRYAHVEGGWCRSLRSVLFPACRAPVTSVTGMTLAAWAERGSSRLA
jgi:hypothetical protein